MNDLPDGPQGSNFGLFGGLATAAVGETGVLVFSNVDEPSAHRRNGTVWVSVDGGGLRWPHKRNIYARDFGYSTLAAGRAGTPSEGWIYCCFEGSDLEGSVGRLARFNAAWLLQSAEGSADG